MTAKLSLGLAFYTGKPLTSIPKMGENSLCKLGDTHLTKVPILVSPLCKNLNNSFNFLTLLLLHPWCKNGFVLDLSLAYGGDSLRFMHLLVIAEAVVMGAGIDVWWCA